MKDLFPSYYRLTDSELTEMMKECIFVLDTNVFFHLYRYSEASRKQLLDIMDRLATQLWIPHQIAYEFQKGRLERIIEREIHIDQLLNALDPLQKAWSEVNKHSIVERYRRDSYINLDALLKQYERGLGKLFRELKNVAESLPDWTEHDPIRERVDAIYTSKRIGKPFDEQALTAAYEQGNTRYKDKIPPGYKDGNTKEGNEKYGDLIIWLQIIDFASEAKKPVVFVTDDQKEDWWWIINGRRVGARIELVSELQEKAGVYFHLYNVGSFLRWAQKLLELNATEVEQVIEEARQLEIEDIEEKSYQQQSLAVSPTFDYDNSSSLMRSAEEVTSRRLRPRLSQYATYGAASVEEFKQNPRIFSSVIKAEQDYIDFLTQQDQQVSFLRNLETTRQGYQELMDAESKVRGILGGSRTAQQEYQAMMDAEAKARELLGSSRTALQEYQELAEREADAWRALRGIDSHKLNDASETDNEL